MKIKIFSPYDVAIIERRESDLEFDFNEEEFRDFVDSAYSEKQLRNLLHDFVWEQNWDFYPNIDSNKKEELYYDNDTYFTITNEEELIERFKDLISSKDLCCESAPDFARYCPLCGKKLNK